MSGAQAGPQGPAVMARGECRRIMYVGSVQHEVKQTWAPHERGLKLITILIDARVKSRVGAKITSYPAATEGSLSSMASEKAQDVMKGKREAARRKGVPSAATMRGADRSISCPVLAAIAALQSGGAGSRTRTAVAKPPAEPAAKEEVRHEKDFKCVL